MPKYYPINLDLQNKKCLIIGGGKVAQRKVRRLLNCRACVEVISPEITPGLRFLAQKKKIIIRKKHVDLKDIKRVYLVIAASDDRKTNSSVSSYCRRKGILVNVVDSPKECNFILPAIAKRGDLMISISTGGISPALSKKIRQDLEKKFGMEYSRLLELVKKIRPEAIKKIKNINLRKAFFKKAFSPCVMELLKQNKVKEARQKIECGFKR